MGPQVRMAGSVSVNKRKTCTAEAPIRDRRRDAPHPRCQRHCGSRVAFCGADRHAAWDFHGFARWWPYGRGIAADEKAQDGMPRTVYNPPIVSEEPAHDAAIHRTF